VWSTHTINAVVVDVDVVAEVFPGGAVRSDLVRLRVARGRLSRRRVRPRRDRLLTVAAAAVRHQRLQHGPRALPASGARRPVVDDAGRLVDAVSRAVGAVRRRPLDAAAAALQAGRGGSSAVERPSDVDHVPRWTVERHPRRAGAAVARTLARRPVTVRQRHLCVGCRTSPSP